MVSLKQSIFTIVVVFVLWTIVGVVRVVHEYLTTGAVRDPATGHVVVGGRDDE